MNTAEKMRAMIQPMSNLRLVAVTEGLRAAYHAATGERRDAARIALVVALAEHHRRIEANLLTVAEDTLAALNAERAAIAA